MNLLKGKPEMDGQNYLLFMLLAPLRNICFNHLWINLIQEKGRNDNSMKLYISSFPISHPFC